MQTVEFRIGTRGSPLALAQAGETRGELCRTLSLPEDGVEIVPIRTTGDRIADRPLAELGGKGLFTKEIDEALLAGRVDLAVHSAKDLETRLADGVIIAACLKREDPRDAFLSPVAASLTDLPTGATIGTSSLRRRALALHHRPDLKVVPMRGNVETRLAKLDAGEADATLLAQAGLARLNLANRATMLINLDDWLPAVGQGAVALTVRHDDRRVLEAVAKVDHPPTSIALAAERAFLAVLDGSCQTPIGGLARLDDGELAFRGIIIKPDGSVAHRVAKSGPVAVARQIGRQAGEDLARRGGADFFAI